MNRSRSYWLKMTALVGGGAVAGVIGASALNAGAAQSSTSTTPGASTSSTTSAAPAVPTGKGGHDGDGDGDGGGPHGGGHGDEKSVTSAQSATLKAEALKRVSGGTVEGVESDSGDAAFEVHMTNAGGNRVTVKFDKSLKFIAIEDGMGK